MTNAEKNIVVQAALDAYNEIRFGNAAQPTVTEYLGGKEDGAREVLKSVQRAVADL